MSKVFERYIYPSLAFIGGTIGVGFLSLPYIASKVGLGVFSIYLILLTIFIIMLNIAFAEVSLKTPDFKRFPGFVEKYFGKKAKFFSAILLLVAEFGTLLAYVIVGSQFLHAVFSPYIGGSVTFYALFYFITASLIVFFHLKIISKILLFIFSFLGLSLLCIFYQAIFHINLSNFQIVSPDFSQHWFLPFGALLFSLWGVGFIPEVEEMVGKNKKNLKKIIFISTIGISVFYFIFTCFILGVSGRETSSVALTSLEKIFDGITIPALLTGSAAIFSAFVVHANLLKETLMYDLKITKNQAFVMACFTPMILFFVGFNSFIGIISFIGGVILSIFGILILLMYRKIKGKNRIMYPFSFLLFIFIIYQLWRGM